ncbi:MAG: non-hydrolyzing UDP-N-acetylglucosamine 2-epimerase [Acidimicrobiales bacterium]
MKVMTILGTRPEIIRLSRVMARLEETSVVDHVLVHTDQNYDYELNQVFFDDLGVRKPDHFLECDTSSLGKVYGEILMKSEDVLRAEQPDAVLILGDTNSALAAIMARRLHYPVFHMEAGNRSFDWRVPEETNRRIVDHISDVNLVYSEHARANLMREGIHPQRVYLTGSPMFEVLDHYRDQIEASDVVEREGLEKGRYILVSMHREENVDDVDNLAALLDGLASVGDHHDMDVLISTHPRTRKRLDQFGLGSETSGGASRLRFSPPFGFHDYNKLQLESACVISDSGTISEESSILGFPAVTPRQWIERPEAMDAGAIIVTGIEADAMLRGVNYAIETGAPLDIPAEYEVANCSDRVLRIVLGTDRRLRRTQR